MFTQRISMDCTKEQYEKYLKDELLKMGHREQLCIWRDDVIVNNFSSENGLVGNPSRISNKNDNDRTYLGEFNASLFLALAAMTDKQDGINEEYFTDGGAIIMRKSDLINNTRFVGLFRKATVSEIMAKFGEQPQKGKIEFEITLDTKALDEQIEKLAMSIQMTEQLIKLEGELRKFFDKKEEPKHKEPIVGEMAIMWRNDTSKALCRIYRNSEGRRHYDTAGVEADNAILFESVEQYKAFINE